MNLVEVGIIVIIVVACGMMLWHMFGGDDGGP